MLSYEPVMTDHDLLTKSEVADLFRVHPSTIDRWRTEGRLRAIKVKGAVRFHQSEVDRLMAVEGAA